MHKNKCIRFCLMLVNRYHIAAVGRGVGFWGRGFGVGVWGVGGQGLDIYIYSGGEGVKNG